MIIGLGCNARVGKDTVANFLVSSYNFKRIAFADAIREHIGKGIFGLTDEEMLREDLKEKPHPYWNKALNVYSTMYLCERCGFQTDELVCKDRLSTLRSCEDCGALCERVAERIDITPRRILQLAGTEAGRNIFGYDLWVDVAMRKILESGHKRWVISDVRFPNEAQAILRQKGLLFRIDRTAAKSMTNSSNHLSEYAMKTFDKWTDILDNNSSYEDLYSQVRTKILPKVFESE